ncbi:F-box associated domain type 3 [Arabidopsis thaliana x Arabidopsis arenosa]|uniref:F-box associated domain type 3 n=1 Tax=Arabidopsis thaliana x Arabidopsis arenosa TaxID=1240361 RepID=A0A8T2C637_9BRAS|nr:F-box associated domain type 3 [Arabidopsis thaliana x Arabidopsis arenosa]
MASSHKCLFLTFLFIALVLIQGRPAEKDMFSTAKEASLKRVHINTIIPIGPCGEIKDCNQKCIELEYLGVFLGYDPIEGKHKVVCMPYDCKAYDECRVLTLGSSAQEKWRTVKTKYKHCPFTGNRTEGYGYSTCVNGVLYYRAEIGSDRVIMSFDVRSEKFDAITLPWNYKVWPVMMIAYNGRLVCVGYTEDGLSMWVLKDANKLEWLNHIFQPLSHYGRGLKNKFKLIGITGDGELIYVPTTALKCDLHIIYVNPMTKTFRRVEYNGLADSDFRQRYGLGDRPLRGLQYFPNHMENLMS